MFGQRKAKKSVTRNKIYSLTPLKTCKVKQSLRKHKGSTEILLSETWKREENLVKQLIESNRKLKMKNNVLESRLAQLEEFITKHTVLPSLP